MAAPPQAPSPPATVTANAAGDLSSITISWSASGSATSYVVQYRAVGGNWVTLTSTAGLTTTWNSPPDATYQFQVEACAAPGCSAWTAGHGDDRSPADDASRHQRSGNECGNLDGILVGGNLRDQLHTREGRRRGVRGICHDRRDLKRRIASPRQAAYTFRVMACNSHGCGGYSPVGQTQATLVPNKRSIHCGQWQRLQRCYSVTWSTVTDGASYVLQEQVNGGGWNAVQSASTTSWSTSGRGNGGTL